LRPVSTRFERPYALDPGRVKQKLSGGTVTDDGHPTTNGHAIGHANGSGNGRREV